jgi:flagellin-specific chaperone FliS
MLYQAFQQNRYIDPELHAQRTYDICKAVDTIKLGIVLDDMEATGHLNHELRVLYETQAFVLRKLLLSENNRGMMS